VSSRKAAELAHRLESEQPPLVLDVRTRSQYRLDHTQIPGSIRVMPDDINDWAEQHPPSSAANTRSIIVYCTCPDDATSMAAARRLKKKD